METWACLALLLLLAAEAVHIEAAEAAELAAYRLTAGTGRCCCPACYCTLRVPSKAVLGDCNAMKIQPNACLLGQEHIPAAIAMRLRFRFLSLIVLPIVVLVAGLHGLPGSTCLCLCISLGQ